MNSDEIRRKIMEAQDAKNSIQEQIDRAKRKHAETGEWADAGWLSRAEHACKKRGAEIAQWQQRLGEARRKEKKRDANTLERHFMNRARVILPEPVFNQIFTLAMALAEADARELFDKLEGLGPEFDDM